MSTPDEAEELEMVNETETSDWEDYLAKQSHTCFKSQAKEDHGIIKVLLKPEHIDGKGLSFPIECDLRAGFLKDPTAWMDAYKYHFTTFKEDEDYLDYVVGLLEVIVHSSPYNDDKNDICTPLPLLEKSVTVEILKQRRDPMRTALKLQHHLQEYAQKENDNNSVYDRKIEEIEEIPKKFALDMMNACITPSEVIELMRLDDDTMFDDVVKSKNKKLIASKFYQKIVWQKFWGAADMANKDDSKVMRTLHALKRFPDFIFWNLFYLPISIFKKCDKQKKDFFSPFNSYLADLVNYSILALLILGVIMTTIPDPTPTHNLITLYNNGTLLQTDSNIRKLENGEIQVRLPIPSIHFTEWVLWACIFSRVLTEWYQAFQNKGETTCEKIKDYVSSVPNLCDVVMMLLLVTGMVCKLSTYIKSHTTGIYSTIAPGQMFVAAPIIYTIYFYSAGAVIALLNFLQTSTIHIPGIGPMIIAMQKMCVDIGRVIVLFVFFMAGFLAPLHGMVSCYRNEHMIDGIDDNDDFHSYKSIKTSLITLTWGMFGGLSFSEKNALYVSEDPQTTIFLTALLVTYATIMGLMCMNILLAMMCSTYAMVTRDKSTDWRFGQFESIMEYNSTTTMPFLFPLCIPYILYCMIRKPCEERRMRKKYTKTKKPNKDNEFAKFLCQYRLKEASKPKVSTTTDQQQDQNQDQQQKEEKDTVPNIPGQKPTDQKPSIRRPPVLSRSLTKDVIKIASVMHRLEDVKKQ